MQISRRSLILASLVLAARPAAANKGVVPFTKAAFEAAQAAGKPILVEVFASWCPLCRNQETALKWLMEDAAFAEVVVFRIDFDTQKDAMRLFGAQKQSTLIMFKGARETARSIADTTAEGIEKLIRSAL